MNTKRNEKSLSHVKWNSIRPCKEIFLTFDFGLVYGLIFTLFCYLLLLLSVSICSLLFLLCRCSLFCSKCIHSFWSSNACQTMTLWGNMLPTTQSLYIKINWWVFWKYWKSKGTGKSLTFFYDAGPGWGRGINKLVFTSVL